MNVVGDSDPNMSLPFDMLIVVEGLTNRVVDIDHRVTIETGYPAEDIIGQEWLDFVHPDDKAASLAAVEKLIENHGSRWACRLRHANGDFVLYRCQASLSQSGATAYVKARNALRTVEHTSRLWHFKRLSDLASDLFIVSDMNGVIETVNAATAQMAGIPSEDLVGRSMFDFATDPRAAVKQVAERFSQGETTIDFESRAIAADGEIVTLEIRTTFDPVMRRWYTIERDVTERVARERELEIGHRFFDLSASFLALIGPDGRVQRSNPAFNNFVGVSDSAQVFDRSVVELLGFDEHEFAGALAGVLATGETATVRIEANPLGDTRLLANVLVASPDRETVFLSSRDVTDEQRLADELYEGATRDQLTNLANRNVFNEALDATLMAGFVAAIIVLDLDDFKRVNDSLGHDVGDELLMLIGQRLLQTLRPDDVVARFGGDEFVILLSGARASSDALEVAERVRLALADPFLIKGRPLNITTSVGVAVGRSSTHDATKLFREADVAAYSAKRAGRNRSRVFDSDLRRVVEDQAQLENDLRRALISDAVDIDVQGIFSIDGPLCGVEALLRLPLADGTRSEPGQFLKLAAKLGLVGALGERVLGRALSSMSEWLHDNPTKILSLNIGPVEVSSPSFVATVSEHIERNRIDPGQIVFEITESGFMQPEGREAKSLDELRKLGVRVAVDDFGAGASSLAFLRDLRIDQIKIHREFVHTMDTNPVAQAITTAVIRLATELGIVVVAAGVSTKLQVDRLRELGCQQIQGFSLHKPVPVDRFLSQPSPEIGAHSFEGLR